MVSWIPSINWALFGFLIFFLIWAAIVFFGIMYFVRWNIKVVILRYQGDKRRPQVRVTKARKTMRNGVVKLYVRGFRVPLRDFESQYYYPYLKSKYGALVLWEPKPGFLTPSIPKGYYVSRPAGSQKVLGLVRDLNEEYARLGVSPIEFSFDEEIYKKIMLKAVDDTDVDFMLQEFGRLDQQYTSGWREFLAKYGGHMIVAFIAVLMFTGFVICLDKCPEFIAQCGAVAQEASTNVLEKFAGGLGNAPPA